MITMEQIRGARAMLGLTQQELAKKAEISMGTLNNIERGVQTDPKISTMRAIQEALERAGIDFLGEDSDRPGVQMKSRALKGTYSVLVIDDNDIDRDLYKAWLSNHPRLKFGVLEAENAKEGYEMFLQHKPACIILDFMMYGKNGFQLLVEMKKDHPKIPPIIFVTATPNPAVKRDALALGALAYLDKRGLSKEKIVDIVEKACTQ